MINQKPIKLICQNPHHNSKPISFLCMKEDCDRLTRLGCFDCIKYTHSAHFTHFIDYKDIFIQDQTNMQTTTYPDDKVSRDYKQFINDYGNPLTEEMINEVYNYWRKKQIQLQQIDTIKIQFLQRIEQIRVELLNKFQQYQTKNQANKEEAKQIFNTVKLNIIYQLQQAYSLSPLKQILNLFAQNKDNVQMNCDFKQLFLNKERKNQVCLLQEKLKQFSKEVDKKYMKNLYEDCSQQILDFTNLMVHFIQSTNGNRDQQQIEDQNNFKLEEPGSMIYIKYLDKQQLQIDPIQDQSASIKFEEWKFMIQKVDKILKLEKKEHKEILYNAILQFSNVEEMKNMLQSINHIKNPSLQLSKITTVENQLFKIDTNQESVLLNFSNWQLLQTYLVSKVKSLNLLYRASRDGMNAQSFHLKCDNKGPTITVIQSKEHERIFGGFTTCSWASQVAYIPDTDRKGFLFSLTQKTKHEIKEGKQQYAIYCHPSYGPSFGRGHDFHISSDFGMGCYSYFGSTFNPIVGADGSIEAKSHLAGAYNFEVKEMEVFTVEFE